MTSVAVRDEDGICSSIVLLPPQVLRPTEHVIESRIIEVSACILAAGRWQEPILVERSSFIVMDGHHRRAFAIRYGFARVPCLLLSYSEVFVESRHEGHLVSPEEIISRGLAGHLFPPKSTRHTIPDQRKRLCNFPLEELSL